MPRIIVLGTGTGVGKTHFTVALARGLQRTRSRPVVIALKPVETGFHAGASARRLSDAAKLEAVSTVCAPVPHPLYGFDAAISAHLAAARARTRISIRRIRNWVRQAEKGARHRIHDTTIQYTLVETAGGCFSPLSLRTTNVDLARALEPAIWIVVAPDALGVLHETTATLLALRRTARTPDFIVLSAARPPDASTGSNAAELDRLGIARPIATLGRGMPPEKALSRLVAALTTPTTRRSYRDRA